ncbi:hypothetical protein ELE36_12860 [Pseudolysobacter antarcticus]|uniref:Peptidase S8/S53 domain-containing protein n=1 Tax=Pseudolysobacter antarcticus TaxID=2511995 RepID=A0A411HL96_9GAMM|nr:S8 family serine peptidase [Pseudolysobacter antarcticus]QBB71170.1 hypothetical protein ELE36_12860 [Pseudolysobacter antarcticus]
MKCNQTSSAFARHSTVRILQVFALGLFGFLLVAPGEAEPTDDAIFANGFELNVGSLLVGTPDTLALNAVVDMQPVAAPNADIDGDLIMTRMDIVFSRNASVAQINAALTTIGAGIVTMTPQRAEMTIAFPRPTDRMQLSQLRETLEAASGVLSADLALLPQIEFLPSDVPHSSISYLAATRFPAAWNAQRLATANCQSRKIEMRFVDIWGTNPAAAYDIFSKQVPGFNGWIGDRTSLTETHGYETVATTAAILDTTKPNGANPFSQCVNIVGLDANGLSVSQEQKILAESLPTGKVVVNRSMGYHGPLCAHCQPADIAPEYRTLPANLAHNAIQWRSLMQERDADMLVSVAAGNEYDSDAGRAYPFFAQTPYVSPEALAASGVIFGSSGSLNFLQDHALLDPDAQHSNLPSLYQSDSVVARIQTYQTETLGPTQPESADNILSVGSTTNQPNFDGVQASLFSRRNAPVSAVGEHIESFDAQSIRGTSFAAPQVTALASYLWLLSDDLRSRPASETVDAIIDNKRKVGDVNLIDAYATVLSLDDASDTIIPSPATMPIRLAVLDVDDNGVFDEADLQQLKTELVENIVANGEPHDQAWGRADLNGDGYVGGSRTTAFDLDRRGSTRYGATEYGTVHFTAEGHPLTLDEHTITDLNILCYYAYSPLYTGSAGARTSLLGAPCASVTPPTNADPGQNWTEVSNTGSLAFLGSAKGKLSDLLQGIRNGAWVATFDLQTEQMGERLQLAPLIQNGPDAGKPDVFEGSLTVSASTMGDAMALWSDTTFHVWFSRFDALSGHWGAAEQPFAEGTVGFATVVLDGLGNAIAISPQYTGQKPNPYTYRYSYYDKVTGQWSVQTIINIPDTSKVVPGFPQSSRLDFGRILVANQSDTIYFGFDTTQIFRFDRISRTWVGPETISEPPMRVNLALDSASNLLATWTEIGPNNSEKLHSRRRNVATGQWSPALTIDNASAGGLVADDAGNALTAWFVNVPRPGGGSSAQMMASYYRAAIDAWDSPTVLSTSPYGVTFGDGSIGMPTSSGRSRIAFHQLLDYNPVPQLGPIVSRAFDPVAGWGPMEMVQNDPEFYSNGSTITTSATGTSLIIYARYIYAGLNEYLWETMH